MKCDELLRTLNQYVDGNLDPSICEGVDEHLAGCDPCQVVIDNIRGTVRLFKDSEPYELPPAFEGRLREALRQRWREHFPSSR